MVNIILKSGDRGGSARGLTGEFGHDDGFTANAMGDAGYKLGQDGFLHLSLDYRHQDHTDHSGTDMHYDRGVDDIFGSPGSTRGVLGLNFEKPISDPVTGYRVITYVHRHAEGNKFYRELPQVYPDGSIPHEALEENEYAATLGVKGDSLFAFW